MTSLRIRFNNWLLIRVMDFIGAESITVTYYKEHELQTVRVT